MEYDERTLLTSSSYSTNAGSGCIAALEAEKFLVEHDGTVENGVEADGEVKKSQASSAVPEYKSNPLL